MNNNKKPIAGMPGYVKDIKTNAILNTNNSALEAYKKQKAFMNNLRNKNDRIDNLEKKVNNMETLLLKILEKVS